MTTIEEAEERLRVLLSEASVDLADGPAAVLPVFRRFCEEPIETESDMILWEVGEFGDWVEVGEEWRETDPLWMFSICRQLERGSEWGATDEEPAGFFQIRCSWHFPPGIGVEFAVWREHESIADFFDRVASSSEYMHAATHPFETSELHSSWV